MMAFDFGVSSACYYPKLTEEALETAGQAGFQNVELFLNSFSELTDDFVAHLKAIRDRYGMNIVSVHPFFSFAESFFLFSTYERRYQDILQLYDRFFQVTAQLGAKIFVIHGVKTIAQFDDEEYCRRFRQLMDMGAQYGVRVCQENVVLHRSESPQYLKEMRDYLGKDFGVVLDIKQARRSKYSPYDFLELLHDDIAHVHISDYNDKLDCIPPLKGEFDFPEFFRTMQNYGYSGKYIIELYKWSYRDEGEIVDAYEKLLKITSQIC